MKGFDGFMEMAISEAKKRFGEDFNTDSTSTWYKLIAPLIMPCVYLEGLATAIKRGMNIYTATGDELDDLLTNDLVFRIEGSKATGTCKVAGTKGLVIPIGSITVKATNDLYYTNTEEFALDDGTGEGKFECTELTSDGNLPQNNVVSTTKAPVGVIDVNNITEFSGGTDRESDYDYLERYLTTTRTRDWSLEAIKSAVRQNSGVTSCDGIRNNTMEDGIIPKKSIRIVVEGGDEQEIAETIYKHIHTADTVGSVEKQVEMTEGQYQTIRFDRPKSSVIDYQYTIISTEKDMILELLKEYLNELGVGDLVSAEEFRKQKLNSVSQINIKVLDLGFKRSDSLDYKSYLQLAYDEKGQAGAGVEV